ncbi:hypothetical protein [Neobacillus sp. LXY-1]
MNFLKKLFQEQCPKCNEVLETQDSDALKGVVIKSCPNQHYHKEFHPALETWIERK